MHDSRAVDGPQGGGGTDGQAVQGAAGARPGGEDVLAQGDAVDVLADEVGPVAFEVGVEELRGAERRDPPQGLDLRQEPAAHHRVGRQAGVQQLDRHLGAVIGVAEVDDALAALAEPPGQPVRAQLARIIGTELGHSPPL